MEPHGSARAAAPLRRCLAWKRAKGMSCTPDTLHTTCTDACRMWPDVAGAACVCVQSHAVHLCGPECTIPPRRLDCGEGYVCPLSGIVVHASDDVATPLFDQAGRCVNHWSGNQRVRPKKRKPTPPRHMRKPLTAAACARLMQEILAGGIKRSTIGVLRARAAKRAARATKQLRCGGGPVSFLAVSRVVHAAQCAIGTVPPEAEAARHVDRLSRAVCAYMRAHPECMLATNDVVVCTWLTLLSTGMEKGPTAVVPRDAWVSQHIPPPSLMALVPRVQCRSISVAVRRFKKYAFTAKGDVVHERVMPRIPAGGAQLRPRTREARRAEVPSPVGAATWRSGVPQCDVRRAAVRRA